ncbi:conjugal transfer protein [Streptomyces sp. NPDC089919]|uniref:conjugal transfer protein n=1 Tax=Streptomyces sp. NPDC089919 TaxID=3155188 RepID=UPI003415CD6E
MAVSKGALDRFFGMWKKKSQEEAPGAPVNPWVTSADSAGGAETAGGAEGGGPGGSGAGGAGAPWVVVPEQSGSRLRKVAFWGVAGLVVVIVARAALVPDAAPSPQVRPAAGQPATPGFPEDAARAVAVRAARAYLTWDQERAADRAAELAAVLAVGVDPQLGWDGHGVQSAGLVVPGPVTVGRAGRARVRVDAQVTSGAGPARWLALDVPVVVTGGGRLAVSGPPALLGVPEEPATAPEASDRPADLEFSTQTRAAVTEFFRAWAAGAAGSAVAPGTSLPALPAGVTLGSVQGWDAVPGAGADRWGVARVVWVVGGGQVEQVYRVQLTRVESARAGRWQVAGISGDDLA